MISSHRINTKTARQTVTSLARDILYTLRQPTMSHSMWNWYAAVFQLSLCNIMSTVHWVVPVASHPGYLTCVSPLDFSETHTNIILHFSPQHVDRSKCYCIHFHLHSKSDANELTMHKCAKKYGNGVDNIDMKNTGISL